MVAFPSLVIFGQSETISIVAIQGATGLGSYCSGLGYRKNTKIERGLLLLLLFPSVIGALIGAEMFALTPTQTFTHLVPFLVLLATLLVASNGIITRRLDMESQNNLTGIRRSLGVALQTLIAIYGGYFSGGLGIMLLGSFSLIGLRNIHDMNALKAYLGGTINLTSFVLLLGEGFVSWPVVILMSIGTIFGGYLGAQVAVRVNPRIMRYVVIGVGISVSAWFFLRL